MTFATRRLLLLAILLLAAATLTFAWWREGRPVPVADVAVDRISCVSYSPSSDPTESMRNDALIISPERIERDLRVLSGRFDCVRTYAQAHGLDQVPRIAHRLGMQTLMGIWIGRDPIANEAEIQMAVRTAARDRDAVRAVVVGNEVLLRGELTPTELAKYVREVRTATGLPTTYADVWEFWRQAHTELAPAVSFMTIHILPYWENEPASIDQAVAHVREIYTHMRQLFPDKPILIGETGWPSEGRQRRGAVPSRVNQARFIREFLAAAAAEKIPYNVIEAFDQPWKRLQEGTVGGYWGFYDRQRADKAPLHGPVTEEVDWYYGPLGGAAATLAIALCLLLGGWRPGLWGAAVFLGGLYAAAASLAFQVRMLAYAARSTWEWVLGGTWTGLALITAVFIAHALARWADSGRASTRASANDPAKDISAGPESLSTRGEPRLLPQIPSFINWKSAPETCARWLGLLRFLWLFTASLLCLLLVCDSRYRDFPLGLLAPVIGGYALLRWLTPRKPSPGGTLQPQNPRLLQPAPAKIGRFDLTLGIEERLMTVWIAVAAVLIVILERPENGCADGFAVLCLLFAGSVLLQPRQQQYADQ